MLKISEMSILPIMKSKNLRIEETFINDVILIVEVVVVVEIVGLVVYSL